MTRLQRTVGNRAAAALLSTGRDPELRLARSTAEQAFAFAHEGQVESTQIFAGGVPQESETDVDEFVLWNFLVNDTTVRKKHKEKLDPVAQRWAAELAADPRLRVRVLGYASVTGGAVLNDDLARRCAESVRDHLVGLGLSEDQIVIDSSGSRLPMDEGTSPQSLARNRRVEVSKFVATTLKSSLSESRTGHRHPRPVARHPGRPASGSASRTTRSSSRSATRPPSCGRPSRWHRRTRTWRSASCSS